MHDWIRSFPAAITVCDTEGILLEMNERAVRTFGPGLLGTNVLDCHPGESRTLLADMLANPRPNAYTIEKKGVRKLIWQSPWYKDGVYAGYVELSLEVPEDLPHRERE